jgi:ABC-type branched-subunit amino acid transport system ATPase component
MDEIRVESVRAGYGKKEILRGITLAASKGELVAIIGPNGAGKSTLLKVIAGFLKPSAGSVFLNGKDVTRLAPHERVRTGIAYFMQGGRVFPSLSVRENLTMAATKTGRTTPQDDLGQVLEALPKLKDIRGRRAGLLSGGERQALALAMALARRPTVLLLDEPSAGLSPRLVREMLDKVRTISQNWDLAVLMVEQNVREALGVAHRVYALAEGQRALESNRPEELLASGELEELFLGGRKQVAVPVFPAAQQTTGGKT